jgi:8-oxo-(d)GTP phosphatase
MKQKYKVFINNQIIHFYQKGAETTEGKDITEWVWEPAHLFELLSVTKESNFYVHSDQPKDSFDRFVRSFERVEAAGGIVFNTSKPGTVLMIFRNGKWDLPKGKCDKGESPEETALREVKEECGIPDLKLISKADETWHLYKQKKVIFAKRTFWYLMNSSYSGETTPQTEEGIDQVMWMNKEQVNQAMKNSYGLIEELLTKFYLTAD